MFVCSFKAAYNAFLGIEKGYTVQHKHVSKVIVYMYQLLNFHDLKWHMMISFHKFLLEYS